MSNERYKLKREMHIILRQLYGITKCLITEQRIIKYRRLQEIVVEARGELIR